MSDTRRAKVPVAIVCDEAAALGHLPILENTVALMRGYGLKLITIWQDLAQLKSIYKDRWESFIGNAGVLQSFSAQDVGTAEYLSTAHRADNPASAVARPEPEFAGRCAAFLQQFGNAFADPDAADAAAGYSQHG